MKAGIDMAYTVTLKKIARLDKGLGFNLVYYPEFMPENSDERGWEQWIQDLDDLRPAWFRLWLTPERFYDGSGAFHWNSPVFGVLRRIERWCARRNAEIMLGLAYVPLCPAKRAAAQRPRKPAALKNALSVLKTHGCRRPLREYAERFLVPLARHLLQGMKLENVNFLSLVNEPDCGIRSDGGDAAVLFYEAVKTARTALNHAGYSPAILPLIGPGCMGLNLGWPDEFILRGLPLADYLGAVDAHHYHAHFDWAPRDADRWTFPMSQAMALVQRGIRYAEKFGKRYYITEMGTFYYGKGWGKGPRGTNPDGPGYHEAAILDAEFIVRAMPLGVGGFLRWCLNPTRDPGFWTVCDKGETHIRHPNTYPLYRQLMRSTPAGSAVLAVEQPWWHSIPYPPLFISALLLPDGNLTVHLVNNANIDCYNIEISIPSPWQNRQWRRYRTDRWYKCESASVPLKKGIITDSATPLSLTTYTTRKTD